MVVFRHVACGLTQRASSRSRSQKIEKQRERERERGAGRGRWSSSPDGTHKCHPLVFYNCTTLAAYHTTHKTWVHQVLDLSAIARASFSDAGPENRSDLRDPKVSPPTETSKPCDFSLRRRITSDCDSFSDSFEEKSIPTEVWLATGTFATEDRGGLPLRFLALSAQAVEVRKTNKPLGPFLQMPNRKFGIFIPTLSPTFPLWPLLEPILLPLLSWCLELYFCFILILRGFGCCSSARTTTRSLRPNSLPFAFCSWAEFLILITFTVVAFFSEGIISHLFLR